MHFENTYFKNVNIQDIKKEYKIFKQVIVQTTKINKALINMSVQSCSFVYGQYFTYLFLTLHHLLMYLCV